MLKFIKKIFNSNLLHYDNFLSILIIFILFFLIIKYVSFDFIDPLSDAFADVEFTDVIYSQFDKNGDTLISWGEKQTKQKVYII